jgi:hypothetical protein
MNRIEKLVHIFAIHDILEPHVVATATGMSLTWSEELLKAMAQDGDLVRKVAVVCGNCNLWITVVESETQEFVLPEECPTCGCNLQDEYAEVWYFQPFFLIQRRSHDHYRTHVL